MSEVHREAGEEADKAKIALFTSLLYRKADITMYYFMGLFK